LFGMRKKAGLAAAGSAVAIAIAASAPGTASGTCSGGSNDGGVAASSAGTCAHYVNPIHPRRWYAGRIDMGVDYMPHRRTPVVAIGNAKILGSDSHSGWPGGHFIWYKLLDGDHAGNIIFVAETLRRLKPAGTRVSAGQRIATALPRGTGIETGWATRSGQARAAPCYHEGMETHSGREMARFLKSLGAPVASKLRTGPDGPSGRLC
jgi:murein DD-endopeptidase MepM/ murein hydrolase activator NlpD